MFRDARRAYNGLRSSTQGLLQERNSKNQWDDRSFWVAAPILCNNLPRHVKKFELYHKFKEKPKNTFILGGI